MNNKMVITSRKVIYFKIEMTSEQAYELDWFFDYLQERHFAEAAQMAQCNVAETNSMQHTIADLHAALKSRDGQ